MANRSGLARITAAEALRQILQAQSDDDNSSIDGDTSVLDNENHISEMSDHSDIEIDHNVPQAAATPPASNQDLPGRGTGRGRGRGRV